MVELISMEFVAIMIGIFLGVVVAINIAEKRTSIFETSYSSVSSSSDHHHRF